MDLDKLLRDTALVVAHQRTQPCQGSARLYRWSRAECLFSLNAMVCLVHKWQRDAVGGECDTGGVGDVVCQIVNGALQWT